MNHEHFFDEMTEKAKTAISAEELMTIARKNGIELTDEKAADSQGLDDSLLEAVSGGLLAEYSDVSLLEPPEEDKRIRKRGC